MSNKDVIYMDKDDHGAWRSKCMSAGFDDISVLKYQIKWTNKGIRAHIMNIFTVLQFHSSQFLVCTSVKLKTINDKYFQFWPYSYYASVIEKVSAGDPNSIGIDILLTNTIDTPFYVYSQKNIIDTFLKLKKELNKDIYFSIKAIQIRQLSLF